MKSWQLNLTLLFLALIFTSGIFVIDIKVPLGIAIGALYCLIILYSWLLPGRFSTIGVAIVCTTLVWVGYALSDESSTVNQAGPINRIISVIVIWVCTSLVTIAKRSFQGLETARNILEEKVQSRTQALKKSEQRIKQMIGQVQDYAIFMLDITGHITSWNQGAENMLGYNLEEVKNLNFRQFYTGEDEKNNKYDSLLKKAITTGIAKDEGWRMTKSGTLLWANETITAIHDENKRLSGLSVVMRDLTERKKMENMLEATSQVARVGGWEVDLVNNTLNWSPVTKEIHEVSPDYIPDLEKGINFYKEGESREKITAAVNEAINNGTSFDIKLQIITAKGNERWVRSIGQTEMIKGKCVRIFGTFQDIHEQHIKDLLLIENEASLREAQAIAKLGSWEWYPSTGKVVWSDQFFKILDLEPGKKISRLEQMFQYIHPEDIGRVQTVSAKAVEQKKAIPIEYRIISEKGNLKYVRGEGSQVVDENGNLVKLFGTLQDITTQTLLQSQFDKFFNNSLELMCIANTEGYLVQLNPKWTSVLGYSEEELKSKPFIEFVHRDDREATIKEASQLAKGQTTVSFINRYKAKSGNYVWLEWSAAADTDSNLLYATARNITESVNANRALKRYATQMEAKNKELEQFAYIASHDLQEPLRTIISFTDFLSNEYKSKIDEQGVKVMDFISDAGNRMHRLIKGLLDYSRLGHNSELKKINCNELLKSIESDLSLVIQEKEATLKIKKLPTIQGYEVELRLLFQNLISNAIKFTKPDTPAIVDIQASKKSDHWEFSVKDNGIGIAEEHQKKVFLIFQRLNSRQDYEGTGIGLANCRKIVDLHQGKIWVTSKPDHGTTFFFSIPFQIEHK